MIITHAFSSPVLGLLPRLSLNVLDFIPDPLTRLTVVPGSIQYILQASTSPLLFVCWGRLERKARRIRRGSGRVQFLNKRVDCGPFRCTTRFPTRYYHTEGYEGRAQVTLGERNRVQVGLAFLPSRVESRHEKTDPRLGYMSSNA